MRVMCLAAVPVLALALGCSLPGVRAGCSQTGAAAAPSFLPVPKSVKAYTAHCAIEAHSNYANTHYSDGDGPRTAANASDCCALCAAQGNCNFWSFLVDPKVAGTTCRWATLTYCCFFHTSNANQTQNDPTWTSGYFLPASDKHQKPQKEQRQKEGPAPSMHLVLSNTSRIFAFSDLAAEAQVLADEIRLLSGLSLETADASKANPGHGDIELVIASLSMGEEEYKLQIGPSTARIQAGSPTAAAWACSTLLQALTVSGVDNLVVGLPMMTVDDWPDSPYRALLLDTARSLVTIQDLRRAVLFCRFYKVRYLHLHLTDDHGWSFPSTAFPLLGKGNIGFRGQAPIAYTMEELKDLVAYATVRGVTIVPELEGPSHSGAMRRAYPAVFQGYGNDSPSGGGVLSVASDAFYAAIRTILGEMAAIFTTSPYFHIGCDELDVSELEKVPNYTAFTAAHGIRDATDMFAFYVKTLADEVAKLGKQAIVWQGAALGRLKAGDAAVIVYLGGADGAEEVMKLNLTAINAPNALEPAGQEYSKALGDFGSSTLPNPGPLLSGGQTNMWEKGWGQSVLLSGPVEIGRVAGQLWWGRTATGRPSNATFADQLLAAEFVRARLAVPCPAA